MIEPRTAVVTIYGGDYLDRIRHLEQQCEALEEAIERAEKAEKDKPRTNDEIPESVRLSEEHDRKVDERDALLAEASAQATHFRIKALGRREWRALVAEHPPRENHKDDALAGVNEDTFKDALVAASVIEPEGIAPDDLDQLADIDFDRLYLTAFALNRGVAPDPKASPVSRLTRTSSETSSTPSA